jgi:hypothetical protein
MALASTADATPTGSIAGIVVDAATREPLAGASVVVNGTDLGAAADAHGSFVVLDVTVGTYTVEASMIGYKSRARSPVIVNPGHSADLQFRLEPERIQLGMVTVRAEHFPKVKDAPVSERNFAAEEIELAPGGSGDIQRVVQAMPSVVSSGDQDNEVIVRGGNPNENLFMIDGIEIPYPNHFGSIFTQGGPINMLNALVVREVDFVAGAFPARFGGRTSSVMDISLKRGSLKGIDGNIDMGMAGLGVVAEVPLPGQGNSFIGSYHKSFLEIMAKTGIWGMTAVPYYDNALGKATFRINRANELSVVGIWGGDRIEIAPGEDIVDHGYWVRQKTSRVAGGVGLQTLFGDKGYGKLLVSGASTHWDAIVAGDSVYSDTAQANLTTEQAWGGRYDVSLRFWPGHETQAGVAGSRMPFDYRFSLMPDTVYGFTYGPDSTVVDSTPLLDSLGHPYIFDIDARAKASSWKAGAYLQHRLSLLDFGHLTLGVRADRFDYTGDFELSPRAGFSTRPLVGGISVHGGYGWHFQDPQWYMLLQDSVANHDLRSRRSDHYIVGLERLFGDDVKLSLEAYYKRNLRMPFPAHWLTADPYDYSDVYLDSGDGRARGIELFLQKKHAGNWHATLAYSFAKAEFVNPQERGAYFPADYDYRHVVTATGAYNIEFYKMDWYQRLPGWFKGTVGGLILSDESNIGLKLRYMSGRPYTPLSWMPETRRWRTDYTLLNSERYPDYLRLDFRWDHKFVFRNWSLAWYVELQNALNKKNVWQYVWNKGNPERETVYQLALWPLGGLVIEF